MSPASFTFKLSVPNDPDSTAIIGEMAKHAAEYAKLEAAAAQAFEARARSAAARALTSGAPITQAVFAAADGALTMTIGAESVSERLS
jgi:hypothetical protein